MPCLFQFSSLESKLRWKLQNSRSKNASALSNDVIEHLDKIEALFFAYRDFVEDADRILEKLEFGRAHHRVLFFVSRRPGLTVAELLDILKITKQSLSRVLRQLIDGGYIAQETGEKDRRQRLLYPTELGRSLVAELSTLQSDRIKQALSTIGEENKSLVLDFLNGMTNNEQKR